MRAIAAGLLAAVTFGLATAGCGPSTGSSPDPGPADPDGPRVVATTTVFADLVASVGGDRVRVTALVPRGGEVHTFDPNPGDLADVTAADLIVANGLGLDEWLVKLVTDVGATGRIVELGEDLDGVTYLAGGEHDDDPEDPAEDPDEHDGEAVNPHLWLDVGIARRYVERIADALAEADPAGAGEYARAAANVDAELAALDAEVVARFATIAPEARRVVSFHDAFPYFAAAYGLEVVDVVVDVPGQEPSAAELAAVIEAVRSSGARAILAEAQFDPRLAEAIADETDAVVVADLYSDSLGDPPVDSFAGLIRWDVERIAAVLEGAP
jgi:ABC-type Zn uptake system ZnuABC Zn-binding protein ZnuA